MKSLKVEYQVKSGKLSETLPAIQAFIAAAQADTEHVAHYSGYQHASEPTKFIHMMKFTSPENEHHHQHADYTKTFVDILYPNCSVEPQFEEIIEQ
jgi:hypothetical protein